jgi:nucleoside-diphosphate-sugar epimerase
MHVLVTGADGFIGAEIARNLRALGHRVLGLVYGRGAGPGELWADLSQPAALARVPSGFDAVVHAAGVVDPSVPAARMRAVNVGGTEAVVRWALAQHVSHLVHVSSVAVYGPLTVGTGRTERTPRLGRLLGLPYMRTKAQAELLVERSGVPFTLLRPPAVLGPGDTVLSAGVVTALKGPGVPLVPHASMERRVSLSFVSGLADIVALALEHGPVGGALHAVDVELTLRELVSAYARALWVAPRYAETPWSEAVARRSDAGFAWLVASAAFGQHYEARRLHDVLGYRSRIDVREAVAQALAGSASAQSSARAAE